MAAQQNQLMGLQAQQAMGNIAMQPADLAMKQSQARLVGAEASQHEIANSQAQAMLDLQRSWIANKQETDARQQLVAQGQASGQDATVANLGPNGQARSVSQADSLQQFADFADAHGLPPTQLSAMRAQIATIHEHEAIAGYRNMQASEIQTQQQMQHAQRVSNIANAAAQSPQNYMAIASDPTLRQLLPSQLTGDWSTDRPVLQAITAAGQDSIKQANLQLKTQADAVQASRSKAASAASYAAADASNARAALTSTYQDNIIKNGGERSAAAKDAKDASTAARQAATAAKLRTEFPPVPLDPGARSFGKSYTAADGSTRATWQKDPASGKGVWVPVNATKALKAASPMVNGAADPGAPDPGLTADDTGE
jgi:hypothetical protein